MVRAIFFGYIEGARTVAAFANLPETTSGLSTIRQRLIAWRNFKEQSDYPTWIMADIKTTRETTEREIRRIRERLETEIGIRMQHGVVIQTPFIYSEPNGGKMIGVTTRLTKDVTTIARRNGTGEFEVVAIPNDDYKKLSRRRTEDKISKCLFLGAATFVALAAYLSSDLWFGLRTILELCLLRGAHKLMINFNSVFKAFKGAEHTDFAFRFLDDTQKEIVGRLEKLENGIKKVTEQTL